MLDCTYFTGKDTQAEMDRGKMNAGEETECTEKEETGKMTETTGFSRRTTTFWVAFQGFKDFAGAVSQESAIAASRYARTVRTSFSGLRR